MELTLKRSYYATGTNGFLYLNGQLKCCTIELPWKNNEQKVSCIPEGSYQLVKRHSDNNGHHLLLKQVPGRSLILIHSANNALVQLQGCIAPVSSLTAPGCGNESKAALKPLIQQVYQALDRNEVVTLHITEHSKL